MRSSTATAIPADDSKALPKAVRAASNELISRFPGVIPDIQEVGPGQYVLYVTVQGFKVGYTPDDLLYGQELAS